MASLGRTDRAGSCQPPPSVSCGVMSASTELLSVVEGANPWPGRHNVLSAFQTVELHLKVILPAEAQLQGGTGLGVHITGVGTKDPVSMSIRDIAIARSGMPLNDVPVYRGLSPGEAVTISCPRPYDAFVITGEPQTIGNVGDHILQWVVSLMEVSQAVLRVLHD